MPRHYRKRKRGSYLKRQVSKNKRQLKNIARAIEYKFFDKDHAASSMDTTGETDVINAMVLGDNVNTREGNKILMKRITVRGLILNINGTPVDTIVRLVIFRAKNQNNANQTILLLTQDGPGNINTMMRHEHYKRFQVLADKTFALDTTAHSIIPFYFTHKCNVVCQYSANTGATTDIEDGAYYVGFWGSNAASANTPTITFSSRCSYLDG